jgi:hypothetical protein
LEQQRLYQDIRLTDEPPEPGIAARTAKSGVNPVSAAIAAEQTIAEVDPRAQRPL